MTDYLGLGWGKYKVSSEYLFFVPESKKLSKLLKIDTECLKRHLQAKSRTILASKLIMVQKIIIH